jgi:hypothetical protein
MPYLAHPPIQHLIQAIPVGEHSVAVEAQRWLPLFAEAGRQSLHDQIFAGHPEVRITRQWFRAQPARDPEITAASILLWGYPAGARGDMHRNWLRELPRISTAASSTATDWPDYYGALHDIGSLGISTISKLAYAFGRQFDTKPALILDQRIIKVLQSHRWAELTGLRGLHYGNAPTLYLHYLSTMVATAQAGTYTPEQLEFFLFTCGDCF